MARERKSRRPRPSQPNFIVPVPTSTARLIRRWKREANGGLLFEKYLSLDPDRFDQRSQRNALGFAATDAHLAWERLSWERVLDRHRQFLRDAGAVSFVARTTARLCLQLGRTGALENAGLALHPVWGVPYIPGTAIKGMTSHFAQQIWKPQQEDQTKAQKAIERIFGTAPSAVAEEGVGNRPASTSAAAGSVIFFEAWPTSLNQLQVDVLNTHYPQYYRGQAAPGEWDQPQPVFFPAIAPGSEFLFALAQRHPGVEEADVELARQWLIGALQTLGAGAKTAAGYGRMQVQSAPAIELTGPRVAVMELSLTLTSPAFLAGANPEEPTSCELRGSSLRGLLRWWWRTIHAGYITTVQLRELEAVFWGSTAHASPITITIEPLDVPDPELFDRPSIIRQYELPQPAAGETGGLGYITYGLAEGTTRRWYIPSGATWRLRVIARPVRYRTERGKRQIWEFTAEDVLQEARAAFWLLCYYGGVGAKARKGLGSLALPTPLEGLSLQTLSEQAAQLRRRCGYPPKHYDDNKVQSPSFPAAQHTNPPLEPIEIPLGTDRLWHALERTGQRLWRFTRSLPKDERRALGLPRRQRGVGESLFHPGPHVHRTKRHAAPTWFHLVQANGEYSLRVTFFPAPELPNLATSRKVLGKFRRFLLESS